MTNFRLPKTPQRRLSRKLHDLKVSMLGHYRNCGASTTEKQSAYKQHHSMITTSSANSPFRVALQNTDIATDSVVITSLYFPGGVPFSSHQDLLDMDRPTLLSLARMLNDKLPKALEIITACSTPDIRTQIEDIVGINPKPAEPSASTAKDDPPTTLEGLPQDCFSLSENSRSPRNKSSIMGPPSLARLVEVEEPVDIMHRPIKRRKVSGLAYGAEMQLLSPTGRLSGPRVRNPLPLLRSKSAQESPSPRHRVNTRRASSLKHPSDREVDTAFVTFTRPKYHMKKLEEPPSQPVTPKAKVPLQTKAGTILLDLDAARKVQEAFPEILTTTTNTTPPIVAPCSVRTIKPLPRDILGKIRAGPTTVKCSDSVNGLSTSHSYVSVFALSTSRSVSPNNVLSRPQNTSPSTPTKHRYAPAASSPLAVHPPLSTIGTKRDKNGLSVHDENVGHGAIQNKVFLCTPSGYSSGSDAESTGNASASPESSICSGDEGSFFARQIYGTDEDVFGKKKMLDNTRKAPIRTRNGRKRLARTYRVNSKQRAT